MAKQTLQESTRHICPICNIPMKKTKGGEYNATCMSCGYEVACCDTEF